MSTDGLKSAFPSPPLLVSTLGVRVDPQSRKEIETIIVNTGTVKREIRRAISPGGGHQERFNPPLEVPLHTKFSVSVSVFYRTFSRGLTVVTVSLDSNTVLDEAYEHVYRKTKSNIEVTVGIQSLRPTVSQIVESCPRSRILVIGKSGVGKSSLINKAFGVSDVHVSDDTRGKADIDQEHITSGNNRFVVHDSRRFEAADKDNLDLVNNFIIGRRFTRDIKDQLHAVWLCLEIPFAGGRLLETGVEEFLRDRDRILGNVPLIVVFTKLDSLVNMLRAEALQTGRLLDDSALEEQKREALDRLCFKPIRKAMSNNDVPSVAVSKEKDYEGSLNELVEMTTTNVKKHIKDEAAYYIATMAQRVNITCKIEATFAFGEKRYWNKLVESANVRSHTLKACLDVLHEDIVSAWHFKDPQRSLYGEGLKEALLRTPGKMIQQPAQSSESVFAALAAIIGTGGTTDPTDPITKHAASVLRKSAHVRHKASPDTVKQLMAYTIDLNYVMMILSTLIIEVSAEAVFVALNAYEQTYRPIVYAEITKFFAQPSAVPGRQDDVLDKIKELILKYRIPEEYVERFRRELRSASVPSQIRSSRICP